MPSPSRLCAPAWPLCWCSDTPAFHREYLSGRHRLGQDRRGGVLLRQQRRHASEAIQRPGDGEIRIVPTQRALAALAPVAAGLVEHLSAACEGKEAVGKTHRHPQLLLVVSAELRSHPLPKSGGTAAQVDRHIKNHTHRTAHMLSSSTCIGDLKQLQS